MARGAEYFRTPFGDAIDKVIHRFDGCVQRLRGYELNLLIQSKLFKNTLGLGKRVTVFFLFRVHFQCALIKLPTSQ